jgi:hypothetical protein
LKFHQKNENTNIHNQMKRAFNMIKSILINKSNLRKKNNLLEAD